MGTAFDREVDALERELADGTLSPGEYDEAMRELRRDYAAAAYEAAERAHDEELDRW